MPSTTKAEDPAALPRLYISDDRLTNPELPPAAQSYTILFSREQLGNPTTKAVFFFNNKSPL